MIRSGYMAGGYAKDSAGPGRWPRALLAGLAVLGALLLVAGCLAENDRPDGVTVVEPPNGTDGTNGTPALSFATDVEPILTDAGCEECHGPSGTNNCSSCHPAIAPALPEDRDTPAELGALDFASIVSQPTTSLATTDNIVEPGFSDDSVFWWAISGDTRYAFNGGGMASSMTSLSSPDRTIIQQWIDDGAEP